MKILVAEAEKTVRQVIVNYLTEHSHQVLKASDAEGLQLLLSQEANLLILDLTLIKSSLSHFFEQLRRSHENIPVLLLSYQDLSQQDQEILSKCHALNLIKPFSEDALDAAITQLLGESEAPVESKKSYLDLESLPSVNRHPLMKKAVGLLHNVAESDITVLIYGESGVGKEVFARALHMLSKRRQDRFVGINCASVPEELLESELFGSERGAYTGSVARRIGKFEMAQSGTLLLDEVSEMNVMLQAKLLRVIQEKELYRVGGDKKIKLDVRLVATTNRDLRSWVKLGHFREDLYYRLNVISIQVPPLRERLEDVSILAHFIIDRFNRENGKRQMQLSEQAIAMLCRYPWPGNIRELENVIIRTIYMTVGNTIKEIFFDDDFRPMEQENLALSNVTPMIRQIPDSSEKNGVGTIEEMEREMILRALEHNSWNRVHAANALGISVRTLRNKLRLYQQEGHLLDQPKENSSVN